MLVVLIWLRLLLLAAFAEALWAHVTAPPRLRTSLNELRVAPRVIGVLALLITVADVVLVGALVALPQVGAVAVIVYLLVVTTPVMLAYRAGKTIEDCGCALRPKTGDASLFVRNAALCGAAAFVALTPTPSLLDPASIVALVSVVGVLGLPAAIRYLAKAPAGTSA